MGVISQHEIEQRGAQSNYTGFATWSSDHTNIATVQRGLVQGVSPGTANLGAVDKLSEPRYSLPYCEQKPWDCPRYYTNPSGGAPGTVKPVINSITPDTVLVGSNNIQLTIDGQGFGTSPTVNLPSGVTFGSGGQGSTDTRIITYVNVATNAAIGPNSITVTANSQTSNKGSFTLDGPFYMTVVSDTLTTCSGCTTTVERIIWYQVMNFSNTNATGAIPVGENPVDSGWNCNQAFPGSSSTPCSDGYTTNSSGQFNDAWSLASDGYTPVGCGENVDDHWMWCPTSRSIGHLNGYIHTNAVSINGVVNPPNSFSPGTIINP